MHHLEILLLGSQEVSLDGAPVTSFRGDTARALLAYLALHVGAPSRREVLAALLWPDQPESKARRNLRQALSSIRAGIGDRDAALPFLSTTYQTAGLNQHNGLSLDVADFEGLIATSEAHQYRHPAACRSCAQRLQMAMDLYRGDLMAGFSLDSAPFEEWLTLERERLRRLAMDGLHDLAAFHQKAGQHREAQRYATRQLELDPWREVAHRQLMRAVALGGQRSAALRQYESCRRALATELGVEPVEVTTALFERIRTGAELAPPSPTPPHNIPAPLTPFVGRQAEMAAITERLTDPQCRLLTVVGPGGIGKTRLALEAATHVLASAHGDAFEHGVFFVSLAPLQSVESIVPTVAQAIGFPLSGARDGHQQLLDYLREKEILLILDNFEHLLDAVQLVLEILRAAPKMVVMVTSRARLKVQSEHLFALTGLPYPLQALAPREGQSASTHVLDYDAAKLLLRTVDRARPNYEPKRDDLGHVAHIGQLVQGMPLAILLAASWVEVLSLGEIARHIREGIAFLEADLRDLPPRQRSLRAVFDHSWDLLSEWQGDVFQQLSVFRGGFTLQGAEEVAGASERDLMALVSRSLLTVTPEGRYEAHELLRQYAAEKLETSPVARETVHERHCAYYVGVLQRWEEDRKGPRQLTALAEMEDEIENAQAAWEWAAEKGKLGHVGRALEGLCWYYDWRGRYEDGARACELASDSLAETRSSDGLRLLVRSLTWQSWFEGTLGRTELSSRLLQRNQEILDGPALAGADVRYERAWTLKVLCAEWGAPGVESSQLYLEQSLELYRELGSMWEIALLLTSMGYNEQFRGRLDDAGRLFEESLALRRELGDRRATAHSLMGLCEVQFLRGHFADAERLATEIVDIGRDSGDRTYVALGHMRLGQALLFSGAFSGAQASLCESLEVFRDLGSCSRMAWASGRLASALTMQVTTTGVGLRRKWLSLLPERLTTALGSYSRVLCCAICRWLILDCVLGLPHRVCSWTAMCSQRTPRPNRGWKRL